ncbi:type II toxin-antitoxin system RelE family toxin [Streptomyces sp. NPDC004838]
MSHARFAFAAHPDAIADLRRLPAEIRDLALLELQNLVHGSDDCLPLTGRLAGFHKVYVDPAASYRMVVQFRPAPTTSAHQREIYLVAAGAREDYAVYRTAQLRTHRTGLNRSADADPVTDARVQAARSRSPQAGDRAPSHSASALAAASPAAPAAPRKAMR